MPEMRPPTRKTQASGSAGVPNAGARPPGEGGVGGASGDRLTPGAAGEPGKLIGSGGGGGGGGGGGSTGGAVWAGACVGAVSVCACAATATTEMTAHTNGPIHVAAARSARAINLRCKLFTER